MEDMSWFDLRHAMLDYIEVGDEEVKYFINNGIHKKQSDYSAKIRERLVISYILGLKHHPKGWTPTKVERTVTPRQIVMGWGSDITHPTHKKGKEHRNSRDYTILKFDQTDKVDAIFEKLGGRTKMVEQLGVSRRMLSNWRTYISEKTGGRGTIPEKYIEPILQISDKENLGITKDDFKTFTYKPKTTTKDKTNGKLCK